MNPKITSTLSFFTKTTKPHLNQEGYIFDITITCLCNRQRIFTAVKMAIQCIQMKKCYIFLIFAQNIDCGYTLEPPQPQGGGSLSLCEAVLTSTHNLRFRAKIMYTPVNPSFSIKQEKI